MSKGAAIDKKTGTELLEEAIGRDAMSHMEMQLCAVLTEFELRVCELADRYGIKRKYLMEIAVQSARAHHEARWGNYNDVHAKRRIWFPWIWVLAAERRLKKEEGRE